ncbi:MAG: DUF2683 family protein [Nanoarchaeota archaeon]|nr:DUF2683 family protein [Nanoarchaeota archaeon]
MVKAMIDINEKTNKVLNVIKAKFSLRDKSQAIDRIAQDYADHFLAITLHPEFVKKIVKRKKKELSFKNIDELKEYLEK